MKRKKREVLLFLSKVLYYMMFVYVTFLILSHSTGWLLYGTIIASIISYKFLEYFFKKNKINPKFIFAAAISLWLGILGETGLYYMYQYYDKFLHLVIPFMITAIVYEYFSKNLKPDKLAVFFCVLGLLCLFEIYEYFGYFLFGLPVVGVIKGNNLLMSFYDDTMWDLITGALGSAIYLLLKKKR